MVRPVGLLTCVGADRTSGRVNAWYPEKGFGFIKGDDGAEHFVHITQLTDGSKLNNGDAVSFQVAHDPKRNKTFAKVVTGAHGAIVMHKEKRECDKCGEKGHLRAECPGRRSGGSGNGFDRSAMKAMLREQLQEIAEEGDEEQDGTGNDRPPALAKVAIIDQCAY